MNFNLCAIASGSSGNCTYLQAGKVQFLIDAGISGKKVTKGLQDIGINPEAMNGIFITHEHSDHIKGVGILSRKYHMPIYATSKTWDYMLENKLLGKISEECIKRIEKETYLEFDGLRVFPYAIHHDAVDPVGYIFEYEGKKITIATDTGMIDEQMENYLRGSNGILLEFNHDVSMLEAGSYPFYLKKRILSDEGHLNNETAAKVLARVYHPDMDWAILGHLSKENNVPDLAYLTAKMALEEKNVKIGEDLQLIVAKRNDVTGLMGFEKNV